MFHSSLRFYYVYYKTTIFSYLLCPHTFQASQLQNGEYAFSEDTTSTFFWAGCMTFNKNKFQSKVKTQHFPQSWLTAFINLFIFWYFSVATVGLQGLQLSPKWLVCCWTSLDLWVWLSCVVPHYCLYSYAYSWPAHSWTRAAVFFQSLSLQEPRMAYLGLAMSSCILTFSHWALIFSRTSVNVVTSSWLVRYDSIPPFFPLSVQASSALKKKPKNF